MKDIVRKKSDTILRIAFIFLSILLACAQKKPLVQPKKDIAFCTVEAERVKAELFYKQSIKPVNSKDEFWITGKLVFDDLKGWQSKNPVPSCSYWTGGQKSKKSYVQQPKPIYSYWTGDEKSMCYIRTLIRVRKGKIKKFEADKLSLEYSRSILFNNVILGSNPDEYIRYFKLSYAAKPLTINGFDIIEQRDQNINYGIEICASFPPQTARQK